MQDFINIDRDILSGTPVFRGSRVPVQSLFDYLENGGDINEFSEDFPSVSRNDIISACHPAFIAG